jgi:hypothetical protein
MSRAIRLFASILTAAAVLTTGPAPAGAKATRTTPIRGGWFSALPAVVTAVDAERSSTRSVGVSHWTGSLTTVNTYVMELEFAFDVETGTTTARGRVDEWSTGRAADGSVGSLHTIQTFDLYADNSVVFDIRIVGGTGDWTGSSGHMTATGYAGVLGAGAHGGYSGRWARPR